MNDNTMKLNILCNMKLYENMNEIIWTISLGKKIYSYEYEIA